MDGGSPARTAQPGAGWPRKDKPPEAGRLARFDGYGDLRFGMPGDEARTTRGGELVGDEVKPDNCAYLRPKWARNGAEFALMFEGGRFVRYDVGTDRETAPGGGAVGMTRERIESLYLGRVEVRPHEYAPRGHYLRVRDEASPQRALVFEADPDGRITRWRIGRAPQVDYVEGCA